ncbi:MAG: tyrosine-type recombinase/integrase [Terriglobia bacterium]
MRSLLKHLRETKVVQEPVTPGEGSPLDHLQASFAQYLAEERGLRPATLKQYLFQTQWFLSERFGNGALSLGELNPQDISRSVLRRARTVSPNAAQRMTIALRNLLRFLQQRGNIATNLAKAVPTVAHWTHAGLPKFLSLQEVELLLKTCDRDSPAGQRNRAMLLLLARLGLRAGEIVHMTLDDIDWEAGELTIRGKGGRQDRLPLPIDVGRSLARYLRRVRPQCASRRVFIRLRAPHQGLAGSFTVDFVVRRALQRTGLHPNARGAHLLRHSLATRMLRSGASLPEIGEILRHQLPKTTAIYTKVDMAALRTLAQPWPGGVA